MSQQLLQILIGLLGGVAASLQAPFAGLTGLLIVGSVSFTMPRLGASVSTTLFL